jgi:hypothetical protein
VERYTSASDIHSKDKWEAGSKNWGIRTREFLFIIFCLLLLTSYFLLPTYICSAELIDRVVAFVDEKAITQSEFNEVYEKTAKIKSDISKEDVLYTMINKTLLLAEAKKLKIEAGTDEDVLNEYMELKVKAFIRIKEEDMEDFYNKNISEFKGAAYDTVRDKIEEYFTEREVNRLLKRHINELRAKAYIKVLIE